MFGLQPALSSALISCLSLFLRHQRKVRPVSMRDGRRLNYLSKEERAQRAKQMQEAQTAQGASASQSTQV